MEAPFRQNLIIVVKDLLSRIGFEADVQASEILVENGKVQYHCNITLKDGQSLLIGQHGANIAALLHIVKLATRKDQPKESIVTIDVNNYFEEKKVFIEREALAAAKEVEESGLPVMLRPMLSFERKLIHHLFASHPTLMTESVGSGEDRKVLLKKRPETVPAA